jgi:hypothetical protein
MLATLASDAVMDAAYHWLCHQRRHWPADTDIWHFRFHWPDEKQRIQQTLLRGDYRFVALSRVTKADGETIHVWSSRDALVLKALAIVLADHLPVCKRCTHVKGHGGAKGAVRAVQKNLGRHTFVLRTDVKGYYDNIDQYRMMEMLDRYVQERPVLNLLWQVMRRTVSWGGLYRDCERGISRGCPLSPLLGAFFLYELDLEMGRQDVFYVRFMDDILVLAATRWKLRRAVKTVNGMFNSLGLEKHPDKTFIGRIERGFDFLGYRFSRRPLRLAVQTIEQFRTRLHRLYEQQNKAPEGALSVVMYVTRWIRWTRAGLDGLDPFYLTEAFTRIADTREAGEQ